MIVAFIHDLGKYGVILGSGLSRSAAIKRREMSGDLVFGEDWKIDQGTDWLMEWEKNDPNCYARRKQQEKLNVSGYDWTNDGRS